MALTGFNLFGDTTDVVVQHFGWSGGIDVDPGWGVIATDDRVQFTVQTFADDRPIAPGLYSARVRVIKRRTMPDGTTRDFGFVSNATPFSISARLENVTLVNDLGTVTGYVFSNPDPASPAFPPDAIQLSIGDVLLHRVAPEPPLVALAPGEFRVVDEATIDFRLPAGLVPGRPVFAAASSSSAAESPAQWVTP